ncbi:PREDICTED: uncharacterized protein LOC104824354 [Tarenaya hassleriana]|uniref:uncharacterized protein LOC104824354 n=1 Tax=Tarenaya hassleriana TaxID=28532 RepID=UPI00053C308D|nr:PREDICTED: uncharacterized protein LOC104824354 [Tarenaya hassleriana]
MSGRTDEESASRTTNHQEEGFLSSRALTKENSRANSSSRVYYYGGATVPFVWETCPGTPKHSLFSDPSRLPLPPPLTPPPSYFSSANLSSKKRCHDKVLKIRQTHFLASLFHLRKNNNVKGHASQPSFSWSSTSSSVSSSSSSSWSPPVSHSKKLGFHRKNFSLPCSRSPIPYVKDDGEDESEAEEEEIRSSSSWTSNLCYGSKGGKRGFSSSMGSLKRALFSARINGSKSRSYQ